MFKSVQPKGAEDITTRKEITVLIIYVLVTVRDRGYCVGDYRYRRPET